MQPSVAILGASKLRRKFGNKAVRAHHRAGWRVFPVNPNPAEAEIEGLEVYRRLDEVPRPLDRVSVYLPPPVTLDMLDEIAAARPREVFFNPGTVDDAVRRKAGELGIPSREACSIVDLGMSPSEFPD